MTVKELKQRIDELVATGEINDDTLVLRPAEIDVTATSNVDVRVINIDGLGKIINKMLADEEDLKRDSYVKSLKKQLVGLESLKKKNLGFGNIIYIN